MAAWRFRRWSSNPHLSEADLAMCALAGPEALEPALMAHLSACSTCARDLGRVSESLDDYWRLEAAAADRAFTTERLQRQCLSVLRRLGAPHERAKILRFPAAAARFIQPAPRHALRRSVAAAALAGLIIGAVAARLFDWSLFQPVGQQSARMTSTVAQPVDPARVRMVATSADEAFLRDFEAALGSPHVQPLRALDALTPAADVNGRR